MRTETRTTTRTPGSAGSGSAARIATPWGRAFALEQVTIAQAAADRRFATVVELLETESGERLVRFAYTTDGSARRGPVTLRLRDLDRLHKQLEKAPGLRAALNG